MRAHLCMMQGIQEKLAEAGSSITDNSFNTHIQTSLSLTTRFHPLFTTLDTTAHITKLKVLSTNLIWHINEESNNAAMEESINQANAAMAAAHAKAAGNSTGQGSKGNKPKWCSNCNVQDHDKDNCYG